MIAGALFLFGAVFGSFLNVCIYRIPLGQSIAFPGSRCQACSHPIRWHDNVPILGFILLGGKCRDCKAPFSWQYPAVEILTGSLFTFFFVYFRDDAAKAVFYLVLSLLLLVESAIDLRHKIIPDVLTLPGIILGAVFSSAVPSLHRESSWVWGLAASGKGILLGGGILYLMGTVGEWILKREAMGGGDVKLLAMIGAFLGWKGVLWTLFAGSLAGAVVGIYWRILRKEEEIPFGPFLGLAAFCYFFSEPVVSWYANFFILS